MFCFMKQHKDKQHSILQVNPELSLASACQLNMICMYEGVICTYGETHGYPCGLGFKWSRLPWQWPIPSFLPILGTICSEMKDALCCLRVRRVSLPFSSLSTQLPYLLCPFPWISIFSTSVVLPVIIVIGARIDGGARRVLKGIGQTLPVYLSSPFL